MTANDPLAALKPLHDPSPIPWWPPAPGWWLMLLLIVLASLLLFLYRKKMAPRRAALAELKALELDGTSSALKAGELNRLLKRYAMICRPGAESLTGEAWLAYLDEHGGRGEFAGQTGRALLTLPYGDGGAFPDEIFSLARRWIKSNRPGGR